MKFKFFRKKATNEVPDVAGQGNDNIENFEICIHCGKRTTVLKTTPIELRKGSSRGAVSYAVTAQGQWNLKPTTPIFTQVTKRCALFFRFAPRMKSKKQGGLGLLQCSM